MSKTIRPAISFSVLMLVLLGGCSDNITSPRGPVEAAGSPSLNAVASSAPFPVSGSGIIFTATGIVHSTEATPTGMIERSTVAGQLTGDLNGSILFNATSVFDFQQNTLVNTGTQFFSGTVGGSEPVILYDDSFRFDIDLGTGETSGAVHFSRSADAPHKGGWFECDLTVVGTGLDSDGNILSSYTGECVGRGSLR